MSRIKIYKDSQVDYTAISNRFIDEYMKDAKDAQLKIYLYLVRIMGAGLSTSISDIADKFNHTEKDVMRALKYWERIKLLSLDFDESKSLVGIHIEDLYSQGNSVPSKDNTSAPLAPVLSIVPRQQAVSTTPSQSISNTPAKPSFSADELRTFKEKESTAQIGRAHV